MTTNLITLEVLQILDTIDRRGSFAKAAEELNKATSALSYAIQKLEEQLGITVFQREGRRSVLTPAGRLILEEGRKILRATTLLADKAKELSMGWEPRLRIAIESTLNFTVFYQVLAEFLDEHEAMEMDISECLLGGGWDALEQDKVDLIVGAPGPVPLQKGIRAVPVTQHDLVPVISSDHPLAKLANDPQALNAALPTIRRVITHDTSMMNITRNAGLTDGKKILYVQTVDHKIEAQLAGLGIGHLPRHRIQHHLDSGRLTHLKLQRPNPENYIAWKISNKGKALQALSRLLIAAPW